MTEELKDTTSHPATFDGAYRGRRISWAEFYKQRPDLRPDNDDFEKSEKPKAA